MRERIDRPATEPALPPPLKSIPKMSWRTRLKLFRQRIILTIRWWFRLEIDDIREQQVQTQIDGLVELNQQANEALASFLNITRNLQARLQLYEKEIPRMRDLKRQYDLEQAGLAKPHIEAAEARESGILTLPARNGKIIHP